MKGRNFTLPVGILAGTLVLATPVLYYKEYWGDPDIISKVKFDLSGKIEKKENVYIVENNLYELLIQSGNYERFNQELERVNELFEKKWGVQKEKESITYITIDRHKFQIQDFPDNQTFIDFLKGNHPFIKSCLDRGWFWHAAGAAYHANLDENKIRELLKKSSTELEYTGNPINVLDFISIALENFAMHYMRDCFFMLKQEIEELKEIKQEKILNTYGETECWIKKRSLMRYEDFINRNSNVLDENEKRHLQRLLMNPNRTI